VVGVHKPSPGFGFSLAARRQLAALAAILLLTMAVLGYAVDVVAALLAALAASLVIDMLTGTAPRQAGREPEDIL
jgi:hypothetical protein